jgi:hypothetical protein
LQVSHHLIQFFFGFFFLFPLVSSCYYFNGSQHFATLTTKEKEFACWKLTNKSLRE